MHLILGKMHIPQWSRSLKQSVFMNQQKALAALFFHFQCRVVVPSLCWQTATLSLFLPSCPLFPSSLLLHPGRRGEKRIASGRGLLFVTHRNPATRRRVSRSTGSACRAATRTLSEKKEGPPKEAFFRVGQILLTFSEFPMQWE